MKFFIFIITTILSLNCQTKELGIYDWSLIINDNSQEEFISLNDRLFDTSADKINLTYRKTLELPTELKNKDIVLILPPTWLPFSIFINENDITPLELRRSVKGQIYASNQILISSKYINLTNNIIEIKMSGPGPLIGFRGIFEPKIVEANQVPFRYWLHDFFFNSAHSEAFMIISIGIILITFSLSSLHKGEGQRDSKFYFAIASLLFIPYHLLTTNLYSYFITTSDLPFRIQIYFQSISWLFTFHYVYSESDFKWYAKFASNRWTKRLVLAYFIAVGILWPILNFKYLSLALIPPLLLPVLVTPMWIFVHNKFDKFTYIFAFTGAILGLTSFLSHIFNGNLYLVGHCVFVFSILGFIDFMKSNLKSSKRDKSAGELLKKLLPIPVYKPVSQMIDEGASVDKIRNYVHGDSIVTTIFVDICSFGEMSLNLSSKILSTTRIEVFEFLRLIAQKHDHHFIKVVGDNVHFSSGFSQLEKIHQSDMATNCLKTVREILDRIDELNVKLKDQNLPSVKIKISATIGHAEFGLEGTKSEMRFDILGHWINATKRLEDAMNAEFYNNFGQNCALVSTNLFIQCDDLNLRRRFYIPYDVTDKHGVKYKAFIGQQYEKTLDNTDFMSAVYGQFSHDKLKKRESS